MWSVLLAKPYNLGEIVGLGGILNLPSGADPRLSFNLAISFLIGFLTVIAGLFFLFQMFLGALSWLNAGGNETNVANARNRIFQALIGLIIVVAAYAVIGLVGGLLGLDIFNPLSVFVP